MEADIPYRIATGVVIVLVGGLFQYFVRRDRLPTGRRLLLSAVVIFIALLALNLLWPIFSSTPTDGR